MPPKKQKAEKDAAPKEQVYKGVYRSHGLYRVRIWAVDKEVYLGHFGDAEEAAAAYDQACIRLRGWDTACREGLNLPFTKYQGIVQDILSMDFEQLVGNIRGASVHDANLR
jgi:hypothetical protein